MLAEDIGDWTPSAPGDNAGCGAGRWRPWVTAEGVWRRPSQTGRWCGCRFQSLEGVWRRLSQTGRWPRIIHCLQADNQNTAGCGQNLGNACWKLVGGWDLRGDVWPSVTGDVLNLGGTLAAT